MRSRVSSRFLEGLLYALAAFGIFAFGGVEPWSRAALEILAFCLALGCFLRGSPAVSPAASAFWLFPAAFAAAGALQLRTLAAPDGPRPWGLFTSAPHATESAVLLWAAYAAVLWSVPRIILTHEAARRCARVLFGLGLALAAVGVLQAASGTEKLYWLRDASGAIPFGPYYNRDHAANVLLMSMAVGAGLFLSRAHREGARAQAPTAAGIAFLFLGIVVCGSRGAVLALLLAAAALGFLGADFAMRARERRMRAAAALAGAAVVVFFTFRHVAATADAGALVERSVTGRLSIYGDAARWWRDTPLFGTGLGSFETIYPAYQDFELRGTVAHAHSDWLEILLEAGLAGALTALSAAALAALAAFRVWRSARSSEMRALIGGALAAAAGFSAHALFEFCFQIPANAVLFLVIVGFLLSAPSWADKAAPRGRSRPPAAWLSLLATACFLFLVQAAVRPAAAAWRANAPGDSAVRAEGLARGFSWDPDPSFLKNLAAIHFDRAGEGGSAALAAQRAALGYSLAAVERMPFDSDALYLAGASLSRLGRPADGGALIEQSRTIRFPPLRRGYDAMADYVNSRRRLATLRELAR